MEKNIPFVWSDNWQVDGNEAWLVVADKDILLKLDMASNTCEYAVKLPNSDSNLFRLNPFGIKCGNDLYLMPDIGNKIWVFQNDFFTFQEITINNPNNVRLSVYDSFVFENKIYAISRGLKQILEIDGDDKVITNYYNIVDDTSETITKSILSGEFIYCLSGSKNCIYQFNIYAKEIRTYIIPNVEEGFSAVVFDGNSFWLSGKRKEIYAWNMKDNSVKGIRNFPHDYGQYRINSNEEFLLDCDIVVLDCPMLSDILVMEQYIWLIPYQMNKILYVDKDSYEMNVFEMKDEVETKESLFGRGIGKKYTVEYVINNRYIGLFSQKNNYMIEIDTLEMKYVIKKYSFSQQCLNDLKEITNSSNKLLYEQLNLERIIFIEELINGCNTGKKHAFESVGTRIYKEMNNL